MSKTRTALQADERLLPESSFSLSFCLTVLVYQSVRLVALERQYMGGEGKKQQLAATEQMIALIPQPIAWIIQARGSEKPPSGYHRE
jgi:hypothetical protein